MLESFFKLRENNTSVSTELLAGLTTYLTMAYILFVNPAVLSTDFAGQPTGLDFGGVLLATVLASAVATLIMGLAARYPIALAPGMGENFFFVSVIMSLSAAGIANAWQVALGIVFIAGLLFFILSLSRMREALLGCISPSLRMGMAGGIGIFIAFIGLRNGGMLAAHSATFVSLSRDLISLDSGIFLFTLCITAALQARRVSGAILWGILVAAGIALAFGKIKFTGIIGLPNVQSSTFLQMDIKGALSLTCMPFIAVFLFMDLFDTTGSLVAVAEHAGMVKENKLPRSRQAFLADSTGTLLGACLGTSTITSFIESSTGVEVGGRTGLTAVVVALLFLLSLIFSPIIAAIAGYPPITASALVIVGAMMIRSISKIEWTESSESIPAFLTLIGIPLFYSIADGIAIGFIAYPIIKLLSGKLKDVGGLATIIAGLLVLYYIFIRSQLY